MLYKCKHGVIVAATYCPDCNKKPAFSSPGNSLGNRKPIVMKVEKR